MLIRASSSHGRAQMAILSTYSNLQIPAQHLIDHAPTPSCVHVFWGSSIFVGCPPPRSVRCSLGKVRLSRRKLEIYTPNFAGRTSKWSRRSMMDKGKAVVSELMLWPQVCLLLSNLQAPALNIQAGASQWRKFAVQLLGVSNEGKH